MSRAVHDSVNALVTWLQGRIADRLRDIELLPGGGGIPMPEWIVEPSRSGSWMVLRASDDATPLGYISDGRNEHLHVTRYDPRTMLAQVISHERTLTRHLPVPNHGRWLLGADCVHDDCGCTDRPLACSYCRDEAGDPDTAPCPDLLDLIACYQHEPGFCAEWLPSA